MHLKWIRLRAGNLQVLRAQKSVDWPYFTQRNLGDQHIANELFLNPTATMAAFISVLCWHRWPQHIRSRTTTTSFP